MNLITISPKVKYFAPKNLKKVNFQKEFVPMPQDYLDGKITLEQEKALYSESLKTKYGKWFIEKLDVALQQDHKLPSPYTKTAREIIEHYKNGTLESLQFRPCGTPYELTYDCLFERFVDKSHKKTLAGFEPYIASMRRGKISNAVLSDATKLYFNKRAVVQVSNGDGTVNRFLASKRGTVEWCESVKRKIARAGEFIANCCGQVLFVTITLDPKRFDWNLERMWRHIAIQTEKVSRALRAFGMMGRLHVVEAMTKGQPHVHMVCGFKESVTETLTDKNGRLRAKNYKLRSAIKEACGGQICDIQVAELHEVENYLTKYVAKGFSVEQLQEGKLAGFTKSERKQKLALISAYCANAHLYGMSQNLQRAVKESFSNDKMSKISKAQAVIRKEKRELTDEEAALIYEYSFSTKPCNKEVYVISSDNTERWLDLKTGENIPETDISVQNTYKYGTRVTCFGCLPKTLDILGCWNCEKSQNLDFSQEKRGCNMLL